MPLSKCSNNCRPFAGAFDVLNHPNNNVYYVAIMLIYMCLL